MSQDQFNQEFAFMWLLLILTMFLATGLCLLVQHVQHRHRQREAETLACSRLSTTGSGTIPYPTMSQHTGDDVVSAWMQLEQDDESEFRLDEVLRLMAMREAYDDGLIA